MTISLEQPRTRRRRAPHDAREEALDAARRLLLADGPGAITLKAVAVELGMAHGNITHHFGSAAGLQAALAEAMIHDLVRAVENAVAQFRRGAAGTRQIIDVVFDAFDAGGAGRLVAWLVSSGQGQRIIPLCLAVAELSGSLRADDSAPRAADDPLALMIAAVFVPALGAALIGEELAAALAIDRDASRQLAAAQLSRIRR